MGNDPFGIFLKQVLSDAKVGTQGVIFDNNIPTTLAFVSLTDDGERDFVFNRGADGELALSDVSIEDNKAIFHFGSATALLPGVTRDTYLTIMEQCATKGEFVSFDPNYRDALWSDIEAFKKEANACLKWTGLLKVSEEELALLGESNDKKTALAYLHCLGCPSILVTLGKMGTLISHQNQQLIVPSHEIKSIDSTGAGDAFIGAILHQIAQQGAIQLNQTSLVNKVGALTCTKIGAISAIPTLEEVQQLQ